MSKAVLVACVVAAVVGMAWRSVASTGLYQSEPAMLRHLIERR